MTVWREGMMCACIKRDEWKCIYTGIAISGPRYGQVLRILAVSISETDGRTCLAFGSSMHRYIARWFRPLIDEPDDAELITRIKNCKPAPAQPQKAQVGDTVQTSPHSVAVAVGFSHVTDSSLQALDNASSQFTDTQSFILRHAERNS